MAAQGTVKRLVRAPARRIRQALFPEYTALLAEVPGAHRAVDELRQELHQLRLRVDGLEARTNTLDAGLLEARRLSLRVAELTDVVTEIVLPLHDREIDPTRFGALADEPL